MIVKRIQSKVILISCLALMLVAFTSCKKAVVYPEMEDLAEFGRSIFHSGEAIVSSDFEESVIKSALIVKARLVSYEVTDEAYTIYEFQIIASIKNTFGDEKVYLYEPKLASGDLLYEADGVYVLVLSRTTDLYYQQPVSHNFNNLKIQLDEKDKLLVAEATSGEVNLKKEHDLKTYEDLVAYIELIRVNNTEIKDGSFSFEGRQIISTDIADIVEGSTFIQLVTLKEVLYENRLLRECLFQVEESYKGEVDQNIIISIPAFIDIVIDRTYLVGLFKDGNYNLSGASSIVWEEDTAGMEAFMLVIDSLIVDEEEEDEEVPVVEVEREWIVNSEYLPSYEINQDMAGWFKIEGTVIDYPVLLGEDNEYYLKHDVNGNYSVNGSIILDYRMNIQNMQNQTLIYGHNMKAGTMFHEITYYKNKEYYDAHPIIEFNTIYDDMKWEVFSIHVIDSNYIQILDYPLSDPIEYQAYLDDVIERSMFISDVDVTIDDKIITLVTCSYEFDGARTILHAKLMD
ncbi:MAG: class B sortase [Vallitaleaceae bacterium]|jgi:sortase B|nr:class B sortase [Vallitaleaceae bacterium]